MPKKKNIKKKGKPNFVNFQDTILNLQKFWGNYGCVILQPYDMEVGAGTFHPATTLRSLGTKPWKAAYVQPSRRPTDGRYGKNPNRLQHYYQFQVILKPSPEDIQKLYLEIKKLCSDGKKAVIGFGITLDVIKKFKNVDGLVVGSQICKTIEKNIENGQNSAVVEVSKLYKALLNEL